MEGRIGKYEIQNEVGRGGFGRVYRAYDPTMGRQVAIKVVTSNGEADLLARFRAEAGVHGKLHHKNIVTIYEYGEHEGTPYIVMELLDGDNLQTLLQAKRNFSLLEKMRIMCQVAEGLYYAHQAGVVHRDVKPANIMLLPNGQVKMMDFGIARMVDGATSRRTRTGDLIGTTLYMSPEQFRGSDADIQSDIFACGVIYYELLCGVHPFVATDVSAVIYNIMSVDPAPLRDVVPEFPDALEVLVNKALAKDKTRRYASLDDAILDLEPIILELRRQDATVLMRQVAAMMEQGDFEKAHSKIKQALELDPSNREARQARETLQEERNRRRLEDAVEELVREASSRMIGRQFSEALQGYQSALHLKSGDGRLQELAGEARERMLGHREASRLLSEAKREAQEEGFAKAKVLAQKALECDPHNPEAPVLIIHLDDAMAKLESAKRLKAGLDNAEKLLAASRYEEAAESLAVLEEEYPGLQQIGELQSRIRTRQVEEHRRVRLSQLDSGLARIRELKQLNSLDAALELINSLLGDFGGVAALENLKTSISEELMANRRLAEITTVLATARELLWGHKIQESVTLLENALKKFPGDAGIERLLESARAVHYEGEREKSVLAVLDGARELRAQERLDEAGDLLKSAIRLHGQDFALSDLGHVISLEIEDRRSAERLDNYRRKAEELLTSGSPSEALGLLREARSRYPSEPSLELLLGTAEERYARQSEREIVSSVLNVSAEKQKAGDLAGAMEEVGRGLRRLPASKDLLEAAATIRDRIQSAERERQVDRFVNEIRESIGATDWARARSVIVAGKREFPDQVIFDELGAQAQASQRNVEVEKAIAGVREHLRNGNLERAAVTLAELQPIYGADEAWKEQKRNLEHRQLYASELRKAENLQRNNKLDEAESVLRRLVDSSPPDEQAAALLKLIIVQRPSARSAASASRIVWPKEHVPIKSAASKQGNDEAGRRPSAGWTATPRVNLQTPPVTPTRTCSSCRLVIPSGARFCDNCGKPV